jgi:Flp pilus assembly CpaF family ATPase
MSEAFDLPGLPPPALPPRRPGRAGAPQTRAGFVAPASDPARTPSSPAPALALAPDWALVRALRAAAAARITDMLAVDPALDVAAAGPRVVAGVVADHLAEQAAAGVAPPSAAAQRVLADAIGDALLGLGRLQPLVDDPRVENIEINGFDDVLLVLSDGSLEAGPPVADSDADLLEQLTFLAARNEGSARMFSPAHPRLHMALGGNARLAAAAFVTPRPTVMIRVHRLAEVALSDLVARDMLDPVLASFLAAAVRAGKSIVVSGPQGSGKTTLVRALCAELDPWERIGTLETERELHLHRLPQRHRRQVSFEARPGSGERGPDGRPAGEIGLDELVADSLRFNLSRLIVGEVRGPEVLAMFKAMQSGAGSMSTTHAHSARAAIERLVTCAMEAGPHVTDAYAYRQVGSHINLIVQTAMRTDGDHRRPARSRFVTEVVALEPGEHGRPATTSLWVPDPATGRAVPGTLPAAWAAELAGFGFAPDRAGGHR